MSSNQENEPAGQDPEEYLDNLIRTYYAGIIEAAGYDVPPMSEIKVNASLTLGIIEEMLDMETAGYAFAQKLEEWLKTPADLRKPVRFNEILDVYEEMMAAADAEVAKDEAAGKA